MWSNKIGTSVPKGKKPVFAKLHRGKPGSWTAGNQRPLFNEILGGGFWFIGDLI